MAAARILPLLVALCALAGNCPAETLHERLFAHDPYVRAGHPHDVHRWAKPTIAPSYCVGYVGGGASLGGQPRTLEEGTWGMDYCGHYLLPHRVFLNWSHGRLSQGGAGRYTTDGPHFLKK